MLNTKHLTGKVGGDLKVISRKDTVTYEGKQRSLGGTVDADLLGGAGSNVSLNGGKTDISSDYTAVGEQAIIATQTSDLVVGGKGKFIGGALTTATPEDNHTVFKQGIETQDITNHSRYKGDSISAGISIGNTNGKPQANMNGIGYGSDGDSQTSTTFAGVTGMAGKSEVTTANKDSLNEPLVNSFDEQKVTEELNAQTQITQAFDQERRKIKTEINAKEKALRDEAEAASDSGDYQTAQEKFAAADKLVNQGLLFDAVAGAIYGPNSNGTIGYVAKAVSPAVSFKIGQYYKDLEANQDDKLTGRQEAGHILAHALLGAAVSYATGNDALTGGVSAGTAEAAAPLLSQLLYEKDTNELTAEQKDTVSSIVSALGAGIGATTGNSSEAANSAEISKVAAENNDGGPQTYGQSKAELMKETWEMNNGPIGKFLNKNQKYILIGTDFLPVIGDIKGVKEAEDTGDYVFAAIGLFPLYGDALQKAHKAEKAYQQAKVAEDVEGMKKASQEAVNVLKSQGKASEATGSQIIKKVESGQNIKPAKVKQSDTGVVTQPTNKASFNDISKDIDKWSLTPISDRQKGMIYDKLSTVKQRSKEQTEQMRKNGFSKAKQRELISQWENETGSVWPAGATPHHAIPLKNGGSNEWWNLVPVKHPHTGTIHGTGSALRENLPYSIKPGIITEIK